MKRRLTPEYATASLREHGLLLPPIVDAFRSLIYHHHRTNPRPMPWRETADPYRILVSEIMLQQTQVARVREKYAEFLAAFPTVTALAAAPLPEVLTLWQGLGYNRRALYLKRCAEEVASTLDGHFPPSVAGLQALPGIGPYTARAVAAFAFGIGEPLIETNIHTVYLHFFYTGVADVGDTLLMPLIAATLDRGNPREWYYALMDYGALLKQSHPNPGRRSSHHVQQSRFEGSNRQLRSRMLREIIKCPAGMTADYLQTHLKAEAAAIEQNLGSMVREGLLVEAGAVYRVAG